MKWKDIKNIIKKELREATEGNYIVVGKKNSGKDIQYGAKYDSKEEAQKAADKRNNDPKYKGISFSVQKSPIKEATVTAGGTKFNLRTGVNKNETKLGIKIQFEPIAAALNSDVKSKLEVALQTKLNEGLAQYGIQVSKDTDVPRPETIGFFIPLKQIKNLVIGVLEGKSPDTPDIQAPEPEGEIDDLPPDDKALDKDKEIEEMINREMISEMRVRDLNEASKIVRKEDFYGFINAGNNIIRDMEAAGKTVNEAKKYLGYLTKHNMM